MSGTRLVVGAMSGTSIDGIDVASAAIGGRGLAMKATLVGYDHGTLGPLQPTLRRLADGQPVDAATIARTALDLGTLHAQLFDEVRGDRRPDLAVVHGQTVVHAPPLSWQLLNPAPIVARLGCPVLYDLRQADLVAGGQGAPITPLADWVLLRRDAVARAIVNLGGFCNITILPPGDRRDGHADVRGMDVCVCNQLLDAAARRVLDRPFDDGGAAAMRGRLDAAAVDALRGMLETQRRGGRSLGTGDEARAWLADHVESLAPDDVLASAVHAVARTIAETVGGAGVQEVVLAGGGIRNAALRRALVAACAMPVVDSTAEGIPPEAREALAMAVLGALHVDGIAITLPAVTGRRAADRIWCSQAGPTGSS